MRLFDSYLDSKHNARLGKHVRKLSQQFCQTFTSVCPVEEDGGHFPVQNADMSHLVVIDATEHWATFSSTQGRLELVLMFVL